MLEIFHERILLVGLIKDNEGKYDESDFNDNRFEGEKVVVTRLQNNVK